jgi:kynurenine---oxoglutarate transaminase / cysteine-S-conjugate beta-lyase / glutamine---phenylpyruvate transaminase
MLLLPSCVARKIQQSRVLTIRIIHSILFFIISLKIASIMAFIPSTLLPVVARMKGPSSSIRLQRTVNIAAIASQNVDRTFWCAPYSQHANMRVNPSFHDSSALSMSTTTTDTSSSSSAPTSSSILATRLQGLDAPTVWQEFSPLAAQYNAINLGQGFPDWEPPQFVVDNMIASVSPSFVASTTTSNTNTNVIVGRSANQYARSYAHMPLATALSNIYTKRWSQVLQDPSFVIDPNTQIATATGCTNVLYCTIQGLINPGDEVILFEPAFDIYSSQVKLAGGIPKYIPLRPNIQDLSTQSASDVFTFDLQELQSMITPRTKLILINTPHNPTGKMFSRTELQGIADIVQNHPQITIVSDEVYEHIIFDPSSEPHISIGTMLPQQTLTLSSAGKTFSATGWKVGWAIGPPHLIQAVTAVQQWVNFSAATPNQDAIAFSLLQAEEPYIDPITSVQYSSYYECLASEYERKRTILMNALQIAGMTPIRPPGGFFIMADTSQIDFPYTEQYSTLVTAAMPTQPMPRDWAMSRWLTETVGVTAIPPSAFYSIPNVHLAQHMLRFAFCKGDATLLEAQARFETYFHNKS